MSGVATGCDAKIESLKTNYKTCTFLVLSYIANSHIVKTLFYSLLQLINTRLSWLHWRNLLHSLSSFLFYLPPHPSFGSLQWFLCSHFVSLASLSWEVAFSHKLILLMLSFDNTKTMEEFTARYSINQRFLQP